MSSIGSFSLSNASTITSSDLSHGITVKRYDDCNKINKISVNNDDLIIIADNGISFVGVDKSGSLTYIPKEEYKEVYYTKSQEQKEEHKELMLMLL